MSFIERDEEICRLYTQGQTVRLLATKYQLGRERVRQILRAAGVSRPPRFTSSRDQFLGVNVSAETKTALKQLADERGVSMSKLASDTIDEIVAEKE